MTEHLPSLVASDWLAARLGAPGLTVLDASLHLPATGRDPREEFAAAHIPGARLLDLAALVDSASPTPQALPRPEQLAAHLAALGAAPGSALVLYDDSAIRSAARAWFMLTASGWENVAILDGGLAKWRAEGRPLASGTTAITPAAPAALFPAARVRTKAEMLANCASRAEPVVDARSAERVYGVGTDPVHGGPMGRIPGSRNLPYTALFADDGTYKPLPELRAAFVAAGIDPERRFVATCGSGVTASVLLFAAHLIGQHDAALYDGSWSEWSADPATPKEQGPAA